MTRGFVPPFEYITAITQAQQAVVTFLNVHDFIPGELISLRVSPAYGMVQANNASALVLQTTPTTVTLDLDSTQWFTFIDAGQNTQSPALAVPAGSGIIPGSNPPTVTIDDCFDDVPF
jgi:hypothetical protein